MRKAGDLINEIEDAEDLDDLKSMIDALQADEALMKSQDPLGLNEQLNQCLLIIEAAKETERMLSDSHAYSFRR